jgi:hypothetical protein
MNINDNDKPIRNWSYVSALAATLVVAGGATGIAQTLPRAPRPLPLPSTDVIVAKGASTVAYSGNFVKAEAPTTGTARIITENKHQFLEIDSAFQTTDQAPDLHVVLEPSAAPPMSYANPGQFINLGKLQKVSGAQRYPIPDAIQVANYQSVVIWCRMANATIGYAKLTKGASAAADLK